MITEMTMANDDADDEDDDGGDDEVDDGGGDDDDDDDDADDDDAHDADDERNLVEWSDIHRILELRIWKSFGCSGGITFPH